MADKLSKSSVRYTDEGRAPEFCHRCTFFEKPEGCNKVNGQIAWYGWCELYKPNKRETKLRRVA